MVLEVVYPIQHWLSNWRPGDASLNGVEIRPGLAAGRPVWYNAAAVKSTVSDWNLEPKRLFRTLAVANFFLYLGFNVWQAVFNNFAVEELGVNAAQVGIIQSLREVPGLMGFVMGFLVLLLTEMRVLGLSVLLTGVGVMMTGWADSLSLLIVGTMVTSVGFHGFYPSNASVVLMGVGKDEAPKMLGRLGSVAAFSAVIATLAVWLLVDGVQAGPISIPGWGYRTLLLVMGGIVVAGSLFSLRSGWRGGGQYQRRRVVFRREYWLYYLLTFMLGSRRHIFTTFAIFLLVKVYGMDVRQTAALLLVNSLISTYTAGQLGRAVARFGERKVLTWNFAGLALVFLGYATIESLAILCGLFILDNIFFGFSVAADSYFQKIARSTEEITSNVSMAQTVNHVSALVVPVLGGILWEQVSPSATFLAGAGIAVVSLALAQLIPTRPAPKPAPVPSS
jgi:MFS family permease